MRWPVSSPEKAVEPRIAAELGETGERRGLERQALRLFVGDHLPPMLKPAQENVGGREIGDRLGGHPLFGMELAQHVERTRASHRGAAAAEDELLGLDEELDLADAAAAELEVVAGTVTLFVAARERGSAASSHGCRRSTRNRNTCAR